MGIDIYLEWDGQPERDYKTFDFSGANGYLRESYHGGPYATRIIFREAFDRQTPPADLLDGERQEWYKRNRAAIPAAVMRERMTNPTEPCAERNEGHNVAAAVVRMLSGSFDRIEPSTIRSGQTLANTGEEAIRERERTLYNGTKEDEDAAVQEYLDFIALAERKEKETGKPCRVYASY